MIRKNIEYERRQVISEADYKMILKSLINLPRKNLLITNTYYDTKNISLIPKGILFRLRNENNERFEFTLKIRRNIGGDIEHNIPFSRDDYARYDSYDYIAIPDELRSKVNDADIPNNVLYKKCTLKTSRQEFYILDYTLVLDENTYNGVTDYDFEVEAKSMKRANEVYNDIVKTFVLPKNKTLGKSSRAIATIK